MGKSEKQMEKERERNQRIIDTAFRLFVEKKIEAVSMDEVAKEAGVGRGTGGFPRISELREHETSYDVCEGEGGQDLSHGYSRGTVHARDGAYHDGSVYPLCRWLYLGRNGQQGLHGGSVAFKGNDSELCQK